MNNRIALFVLVITLFLATIAATGTAAAASVQGWQKFTFHYQKTQTAHPGRYWIDEKGLHIRDRIDLGFISGDVVGVALVIYNADMPLFIAEESRLPLPKTGEAYGTIQIFGTNTGKATAAWEGRWTHSLVNGEVVAGDLMAWNVSRSQFLNMDTVYSSFEGLINFEGALERILCYGAKCPIMA